MWERLLFALAPIVVHQACEYYRERAKRQEDRRMADIERRIAQIEAQITKK